MVGQLAARLDAELGEDVRQMRARRPRRDAERRADLLVRSTRRDETHDLELAARETGDAGLVTRVGGRAPSSRSCSRVASSSRSAPRCGKTSCARRSSRIAPSRSPVSASARASCRRTRAASGTYGIASSASTAPREQRDRALASPVSISTSASHASAHASPSRWPSAVDSRRMRSAIALARVDVVRPQRRFGDHRHEPMDRPDDVARSIGDRESMSRRRESPRRTRRIARWYAARPMCAGTIANTSREATTGHRRPCASSHASSTHALPRSTSPRPRYRRPSQTSTRGSSVRCPSERATSIVRSASATA